ncbi:MAG: TAXI family TRAP transporter solute-binding subunit [Eggerthellaceae bacterium]|nr:TAXI family TRAP transporter solute-binding subunit [Eggerthellaceae bacterium]
MKNLTRRGFIGVGASAAMAAALVGCSSGGSSSAASSASASSAASSASASSASASASAAAAGAMRFVTGGETGTYYALGTIMAQNANAKAGLDITAVSSGGSQANVLEIEDGTAQLGFCQIDVATYAFEGTNVFDGMPVSVFSTVACLYEEQVQIVTCDENIKSVADLKGKNVSIGAAGSGVYFNAVDILGAYGIDAEKDISPTYQSFGDSAESLKDGKIDAAFVVAGAPTTAITDLSTTKQAYLVALDAEHTAELVKISPYYNEAVIKGGTYAGIDEDIATLSVSSVILAADTCSEDDVYAFTASIFDNLEELKASNAKFEEFNIEKAASIKTVPYHAGAAKYFTEKGFEVATK